MTTKKVKVDVDADTRDAVNGMKRLRDAISGTTGNLNKMSDALTLGNVMQGAQMFAQLAGRISDAAKESLKTQAVFGGLTISIGAARKASNGLISDLDLATKANEAMRLGVVKTGDQFGELVDVSARLGASVGLDAKDAMNSLTTAIGRQSPLMLDNLGIMLKVSEANEIYAARIGKTASQLTDAERKTAFQVIAMERAKKAAEGLTIRQHGLGAEIARVTTLWDNYSDRLLSGVNPRMSDLHEALKGLTAEQRKVIADFKIGDKVTDEYSEALRRAGIHGNDFVGQIEAQREALKGVAQDARAAAEALDAMGREMIRRRNEADELAMAGLMGPADIGGNAEAAAENAKILARKSRRGGGGGRKAADTENPADATLAGQLFFAEQNEAKRELLEQQLEIERDANDAQAKAEEQHAKELAKIAKARAKELERIAAEHARRVEAIQTSAINTASALGTGMVSALIGSATDQKKVFAEEVKIFAGAKAKELTVQAAMHGFKAAAWAAALNPVKATAEGIAAGIAGAGAASMAATYGVASAAVGGGGGGASASGPGNAFNLGGGRDGQSVPDAPISPLEDGLGASRPSGASSGGGTVINVSGGLVDGEKLARILQDYDRTNGRILA